MFCDHFMQLEMGSSVGLGPERLLPAHHDVVGTLVALANEGQDQFLIPFSPTINPWRFPLSAPG